MTADAGETYGAVAIDGELFAHAHIVDFIVEHDDGYTLLPDLERGRKRLRSEDELDDLIDRGLATLLNAPVDVGPGEAGLLLDEAIPALLDGDPSNPLDAHEKRVRTTENHLVVVDEVEELDALRAEVAGRLDELTKQEIVQRLTGQVRGAKFNIVDAAHESAQGGLQARIISEASRQLDAVIVREGGWSNLVKWTDYAIDCGSGSVEHQYQPILLRCWLLRRQLESTQMRNFYNKFAKYFATWEDFEREIDDLERTFRAAVEHQLWRDLVTARQRIRTRHAVAEARETNDDSRNFFDSDPSAGGLPRNLN